MSLCLSYLCLLCPSCNQVSPPEYFSHKTLLTLWKHLAGNFMSTGFRIVGPCSPVARTAAQAGGQYHRPAEGEMTCTFTSLSWTVPQSGLRPAGRCGSQSLTLVTSQDNFRSSTHLQQSRPAGDLRWPWMGGSGEALLSTGNKCTTLELSGVLFRCLTEVVFRDSLSEISEELF